MEFRPSLALSERRASGPKALGLSGWPQKGAMPEPADLEPKRKQRRAVRGHPVVTCATCRLSHPGIRNAVGRA